MRRRGFILGIFCTANAWPASALAQLSTNRRLIGFLDGKSQQAGQGLTDTFLQGLRELGYQEGRNIDIVYRFADGRDDRLPSLAEEIVRLHPKLIVAPGVNAAVAAKKVSDTIPIVSWALADATHLGLIKSYSRPGGMVTGVMPYVDGLPAKQMELAREVVPGARKIGILGNSNDPKAPPNVRNSKTSPAPSAFRLFMQMLLLLMNCSEPCKGLLAPKSMPRSCYKPA